MRSTSLVLAALLSASAYAHDHHHALVARQAPSSSSTAPPAPSSVPPTGTPSVPASGTASAVGTSSSPSQVSVSLISSNPTAVPLPSITANMTSSATVALYTTFPAGSTPTAVTGAPLLPDAAPIIANPAQYPPLDKTPPTDSPEVQQWITEVQNSGISIPNISITVAAAACGANTAAAADQSRCWWTCGGCTRDTDITTCADELTWGLTYDDGPAFYTPNLLTYLNSNNLKTTFFTIGSRILEEPVILQTEYMLGHQLGVHTWSHPPLTTLTNEQIIAEFGWTKKIMKDLTGVTPNTFRPPFGDIDDRVRAIAQAMSLQPVIWTRLSPTVTFDTGDFNINAGTISSSQVISNFNAIMNNATQIQTGFIVLEHDLFEQTVDLAIGYILPEAMAHNPKFTLEPVITCQKMPLSNAYIETNDNTTHPPFGPNATSSSGSGSGTSTGGGSQPSHTGSSAAPSLLSASTLVSIFATAGLGIVAAVFSLL